MLWESIAKAINLGLREGFIVADLLRGLMEEVVARDLRLRRGEGSLRRSGEALHNSVELVPGNGGSISGDGDD
jgi:hypothetical protein